MNRSEQQPMSAEPASNAAGIEPAQQLALLLEHAPAAVAILDDHFRYVSVTRRWFEELDLDDTPLIGRAHAEVLPETAESWMPIFREALRGTPYQCSAELIKRRGGWEQWIKWEARPWMSGPGQFGGIAVFLRDVTQRVQTEQAVAFAEQESRLALERANAELRRAKSIFDQAERAGRLGTLRVDLRSGFVTLSDGARAALGLVGADTPRALQLLSLVDAGDARRVRRQVAAARRHGGQIELEGRLRRSPVTLNKPAPAPCKADSGEAVEDGKPGDEHWICLRAQLEMDNEGEPRALVGIVVDISSQKMDQARLRESEARFERVTRGSSDGFWDWDLASDRVYFSPRYLEMVGHHGPAPTDSAFFFSALHTADVARVWAAIRAHLDERKPYDVQFRLRTSDGRFLWIRSRGEAQRDHRGRPIRMSGCHTDITAWRQSQDQLLTSEQRFQAFAEESPALIWASDSAMRMSYVNAAWERYSGQHASTCLGMGWLRLVHEADRRAVRELLAKESTGPEAFQTELRLRRADGSYRWFTVRGRPVPSNGADGSGLVGTMLDVDDQHEISLRLAEARRQADANNRAKSEFLAVISHELRTPITAMLGFLELLADPQTIENDRQLAQKTVAANGRALLKLLNDVLDLTKIEAERLEVNPSTATFGISSKTPWKRSCPRPIRTTSASSSPITGRNGSSRPTRFGCGR